MLPTKRLIFVFNLLPVLSISACVYPIYSVVGPGTWSEKSSSNYCYSDTAFLLTGSSGSVLVTAVDGKAIPPRKVLLAPYAIELSPGPHAVTLEHLSESSLAFVPDHFKVDFVAESENTYEGHILRENSLLPNLAEIIRRNPDPNTPRCSS